MNGRWLLVGVLLLGLGGAACADQVTLNSPDHIDINRTDYVAPQGYAVAPAATVPAQTVATDQSVVWRDGSCEYDVRRDVAVTDREHLWNPFVGEVPWLDAPIVHKYVPRQ